MTPVTPRILAHRGASGDQPENSLAAFREARRAGADGVELDVHASADGHLLVHHDHEIPRLGAPTLSEALEVLGGMEVWIELKSLPAPAEAGLLAAIDAAPTPVLCRVHSFDHRIIARLGAQRPGLRRGILSASYPLDPVGPMAAAGADTLWQEWRLIDEELVALVHRTGGSLIAWTVNEASSARRLADLGVDGLCGNYPERLRIR
ncbi:MAG TPA: glycerophosphodiester phosphodiesterase [Thermoanaerobaculia bacterium]|nr:glycerophosphodiester phosphodiesterase [Thermoanaerobaculia bacterium]